jgi:hypothetical protein
MKTFIRSSAAAAVLATLAAAPALADAPMLPMRPGEVVTPSALAEGEQYLSISKTLDCALNTCTAEIKGRARRQTLITHVACLSTVDAGQVFYGAVTKEEASRVALAILPVASRTAFGNAEHSVISGPTQVVIGPTGSVFVIVQAIGGTLEQAACSLTGTTTKL